MFRNALLICGILSSSLYVAMTVFIAAQWADYNSASQTISELSTIDAHRCQPADAVDWCLGTSQPGRVPALGRSAGHDADANAGHPEDEPTTGGTGGMTA